MPVVWQQRHYRLRRTGPSTARRAGRPARLSRAVRDPGPGVLNSRLLAALLLRSHSAPNEGAAITDLPILRSVSTTSSSGPGGAELPVLAPVCARSWAVLGEGPRGRQRTAAQVRQHRGLRCPAISASIIAPPEAPETSLITADSVIWVSRLRTYLALAALNQPVGCVLQAGVRRLDDHRRGPVHQDPGRGAGPPPVLGRDARRHLERLGRAPGGSRCGPWSPPG